jgi:type I restriction enzyme R subunit
VVGLAVVSTSNFAFLSGYDAQLAQLGALAERYFHDDPGTAILKLRRFAELSQRQLQPITRFTLGARETFEETLRRLSFERVMPREAADLFHALRKAGNKAAHETTGNHSDAFRGELVSQDPNDEPAAVLLGRIE